MGFLGALQELNSLIETGIIKDYAIGGGYAVIYYNLPYGTYDLDVLVIFGSEADSRALYKHFKEKGNKIKDVYIYIDDMPVQFFPTYISPLFNSAVREAHKIKIEGIPSKVVTVEYLIALLLNAFRPKDKIRIAELLEKADKKLLDEILGRFDDEKGILHKRFKEVLASS